MVLRAISWSPVLLWGLVVVATAAAQSRPYAPGVLTVIPPNPQYEESYSGPMEMMEISRGLPETNWDPNYTAKSQTIFEQSKLAVMRRDVWCLEFAFKPLRTLQVDVPQASGKLQQKLVWYLVYRVRYLGDDLVPDAKSDEWGRVTYRGASAAREGRYFFPRFILESLEFDKAYQDRIIPTAKKLIEQREARGETLLNSVEIGEQPIPLSTEDDPHEVWGVAMWEDIDPRIDFFSVFVAGLTNAYKPVNLPNAFTDGAEPGAARDLLQKELRLNFWRPGDVVREEEDNIYFGIPYSADATRQQEILTAFGLTEPLDYLWVYR